MYTRFAVNMTKHINESTIRTMKKGYLLQKMCHSSDSDSEPLLQRGKRGQHTFLGKYDAEVQEYIRNLRLAGGIVDRPFLFAAARRTIVAKDR